MAANVARLGNIYQQFPLAQVTDLRDPRLRSNVVDVFKKYFTSKDFVKTIYYAIDWASRFTQVPSNILDMGKFFKRMKNAMGMANIYGSFMALIFAVNTLAQKCWTYSTNRPGELRIAVLDVGRQFSDWSNNMTDTVKLFAEWFSAPLIPFLPYVEIFSSGCTFLGSVNNFVDDGIKFAEAPNQDMRIMHGFGLGMDMCYMMVGALGLWAWWIAAPVSVILIPLTMATACRTGQIFFQGLNNPDGRSADPAKVQRALQQRVDLQRAAAAAVVGFA